MELNNKLLALRLPQGEGLKVVTPEMVTTWQNVLARTAPGDVVQLSRLQNMPPTGIQALFAKVKAETPEALKKVPKAFRNAVKKFIL